MSSPRIRLLATALLLALGAALSAGCRPGSPPEVDELVDRFAEREGFHGIVLVARGDSVLYAKPYGFEDIENRVPTRLDTRYQLGSLAKWITSVVVMDLVDEGVLDLDAPLTTYLPDLCPEMGRAVTLRHLLANRSGVPNALIAAYQADPSVLDTPLTTDAAVRRFASGDLRFMPGTDFDYSHANWILVQAIVERAMGAPLDAVVRERIVRPLGLSDTGAFWDGGPDPAVAPGYETLAPTPVRADLPAPRYLMAAGGLYSTAPDLLALVDALYDERLLLAASQAYLSTITTPERDLSEGGRVGGYACGGRVRAMQLGDNVRTVLWLTGSNGPWKARISRVLDDSTSDDPDDGLTVITLTNVDVEHEATGALAEDVLGAFYRQPG